MQTQNKFNYFKNIINMTDNKQTPVDNTQIQPKNPRTRRVVNRNQTIPNKKVKKWASIWWKWIIIGILIFLVLIIAIMFFFFFYLTNNPNAAKWLGMWPSSIKSITSVFAGILFWSLFVLFLVLWLINIYKLSIKKEWKFRYWLSSFVIFLLWITNIIFWVIVFSKISKIKTWNIIASTNVLIWNVEFSNPNNPKEPRYVSLYNNNYPLIWPIKILFLLNKDMFNRVYYPQILNKEKWWIIPVSFILNCGNWQILRYNWYNFSQNKYCLYLKKWEYNIKFKFIYNTKTEKNKEFILPGKKINIASQVNILSKYNIKNKNDIIIWRIWDLIKLNLSNIPIDLNLISNELGIDYKWNWQFKKAEWIITFSYKTTWIHYINIKIPWNTSYPIYRFPVRVLSSDKPMCNIWITNNNNKYSFKLNTIPYAGNPIVKYEYKVLNVTNNNIIKSWKKEMFNTMLNNGSDYQVQYKIIDTKWNKWECSSSIIRLSNKINYKYNIKINNKVFTGNHIIYEINQIPFKYNIQVWKITPNNNVTIWFDLNNNNQIDELGKKYTWIIKNKKWKTINVIVKDAYWNKILKKITFKVRLKNVIAKLLTNKIKWSLPLTVKFDASTSIVNTPNDSIVFFNRNFWDGQKDLNTNQWVIEHTYTKYWTYKATVNIKTTKWYSDTGSVTIFVQKPINTATITFPNNLWWQISVWENLVLNLDTNWPVKSVNWDFGDGKQFSCNWRECMQINHTYLKKWLYRINAKITYLDGSPTTTATSSINVINN